MNKSFVIVISGVTASGKTTLINALQKQLTDSKIISFDDYSIDALPSAPPIDRLLKEAVNQYDISTLMNDFLTAYGKCHYLLVDFPFGYKHQVLKPYINQVFYVQTPLDICLARQVLRDYPDKSGSEIRSWLKTYLEFARPMFVDNQQYISEDADLIIDGTLGLTEKVKLILQKIRTEKE